MIGGVLLLTGSSSAYQTTTVRVSVDSAGNQANNASEGPSISADGRYIVFVSTATNLVPNDTNGEADVFVHDRQAGMTERVNVGDGGVEANRGSWGATLRHSAISDDGGYVAFNSLASNLVPGGNPGTVHVFLWDRDDQTTVRVASGEISDVSTDGRFVVYHDAGSTALWDAATGRAETIARGGFGSVSADGRYVAYIDGKSISLRDRVTETTRTIQEGKVGWPSISSDGRYIAFQWTLNDSAMDGTGIFVYDREADSMRQLATGWMPKISAHGGHVVYASQVAYQGAPLRVFDLRTGTDEPLAVPAAAGCIIGAPQDISGDGKFVAFSSCTPDLVAGDTNECGFGPLGTCPDIFVHDRGEQPGAPTTPPALESPVPVLPPGSPSATPCAAPAETASPGASFEASPLESDKASTSPTLTDAATPTFSQQSSGVRSPCPTDELDSADGVESETSLSVTRVAGAAAGGMLLIGASALGYARFRRRRLG